ncbi:hypothetical protein BC830DRAFT_1137086 [Chytriomyces sp. MP71]|nr:hypothetical protein BC830DRAFT_1137086 [Chytriomyces sp. MP71]
MNNASVQRFKIFAFVTAGLARRNCVHADVAKCADVSVNSVNREHAPTVNEDDDYNPLDAILVSGNDPVASFIKHVELHEVVPRLGFPFHELWTHSGILVDKTVLPSLDWMEDGKLYLYESVFSGEVAGYVYSRVLPLDHTVKNGSFHLGPQVRDFAAVVAEGDSDVGIAPLSPEARRLVEAELKQNPNLIQEVYDQYHEFGYPITNILPVLAAASQNLYNDLRYYDKVSKEYFPHHADAKKTTVFCSELVSIIYQKLQLPSFKRASPDTFTPLAIEVAPEFGNVIYYAKEDKVQRLVEPHDRITTQKHVTKTERIVHSYDVDHHWVRMAALGGAPPNAAPIGHDEHGKPFFAARTKIGKGYHLGKIAQGDAFPTVTYLSREIPVNFGHEVLVSMKGLEFVNATGGKLPEGRECPAMGLEDDGETRLYLARGVVGESHGFLGFGAHKASVAPGSVADNNSGARVGFEGEEVKVDKYQVLCRVEA